MAHSAYRAAGILTLTAIIACHGAGSAAHNSTAAKPTNMAAALQEMLDRHLSKIDLKEARLDDTIDYFRDSMSCNIAVDWGALHELKIDPDKRITAKARDIKFSRALDLVFEKVEGTDDAHRVIYFLNHAGNCIEVTTYNAYAKTAVETEYDLSDLLQSAPADKRTDRLAEIEGQFAVEIDSNHWKSNELIDGAIKAYLAETKDRPTTRPVSNSLYGDMKVSNKPGSVLITQTPENHASIQRILNEMRHIKTTEPVGDED